MLDALVRWYARPPGDDAGLEVALDHARRLLRPGSRLLVLADPASIAAVPGERWPALAAHHQVVVVLLTDPLETSPPEGLLAFAADAPGAGASGRIELDLGAGQQRQRWQDAFAGTVSATASALSARGVHVVELASDAPSDAWLSAAAGRG